MKIFGRELFKAKPAPGDGGGAAARPPEDRTRDTAYADGYPYVGPSVPTYNTDDLVGRKGYGIYKRMMKDEQVKAVVHFRRNCVTERPWEFYFDDEEKELLPDADQELRIKIFTRIITRMQGSFKAKLDSMMSAMQYGFSLTEKVYELFEYDGKTWYGIAHLRKKKVSSFFFYTDDFGNLIKLEQRISGKYVVLDINKFIHVVRNEDEDEYYGLSELAAAYRAWLSKDTTIRSLNLHMDRAASGFNVLRPIDAAHEAKPGTPKFIALQLALDGLKNGSSFLLPYGYEMDTEMPRSEAAFTVVVAMHDAAIAKALLTPNLMGLSNESGSKGGLGSGGQSDVQMEAFLWMLDSDADSLAETLDDQMWKELGDYNFGDGLYPKFRFLPLSDTQMQKVFETWTKLVTAGAVEASDTDEEYLRSALDMPEKGEPLQQAMVGVDPATGLPTQVPANKAPGNAPPGNTSADKTSQGEKASKDKQKFGFNPDQPRDEHGRWGEGGGGASNNTATGSFQGGPATGAIVSGKIAALSDVSKAGGYRLPYDSPDSKDLSVADALTENAMSASQLTANHELALNDSVKVTQSIAGLDHVQTLANSYDSTKDFKPPVVVKVGHDYIVIDGHNRIAAATLSGAKTIPVFVAAEAPSPKGRSISALGDAVDAAKKYSAYSARVFAAAEKRVDFAEIDRRSKLIQVDYTHRIANWMGTSLTDMVDKITKDKLGTRDGDAAAIAGLKFTPEQIAELRKTMRGMLRDAWDLGQEQGMRELRSVKARTSTKRFAALQDMAASYFDAKSFIMAGSLNDKALATIKSILVNGIRYSKSSAQIADEIYTRFAKDGMLNEADVREALGTALGVEDPTYRLATMVRTNSFDAINEARRDVFNDPDLGGFVEAMQYSAILDDRTTEICSSLDGMEHAADWDGWDTYNPPNHFNCRSVLVPIFKGEEWQDTGTPSALPQEGFK